MSDYGYPAPPPEDGRPYGNPDRTGGRAYGSASNNSPGEQDYGWGGSGSAQPRPGHPGAAPAPGQGPGPRPQPYGTPASGSASVGRASGAAPVGRPSGSASVGSASVGGATGSASVGGPGRSGRASVGSASVGSASVGSASVGSASVGSGSAGGDFFDGAGDRTGRASVTGRRRAGNGPLNRDDLEAEGGKKKRKRLGRKMLAALVAMGVLFIAAVTVVGSYFFVNVDDPGDIRRNGEASVFTYADGSTEAGAYGATLRLQAENDEIPETVKKALVATEDRKFYEHGGVDFRRTIGAMVNNLTGGSTQGASTITQQYAGMVMDIRQEISYDRKAREAAMAMKMESEYSKDDIISAYLNLAYFGRGATGIEAAAKVYYNKPLKDLTWAEASYIVMQVKSPNGTYDHYYEQYYDEQATQERWDYSMDALVEVGYLSQAERDEFELPKPIDEFNSQGSWGGNTDLGFIINQQDGYVYEELYERYGLTTDDLYGEKDGTGGYKVVLTIDPEVQASLRTTGSRGDVELKMDADGNYLDEDDNPVESADDAAPALSDEGYAQFKNDNPDAALEDYKEYMMSAMVAIDPETGAVIGYYGGDDGFGVDKAGAESPHPPSSTMKMVTAATAIKNDDSINSWFNAGSPRPFDTLELTEAEECIGSGTFPNCTLRNGSQDDANLELQLFDAVRDSKNTPMYSIAEQYGASSILQTANSMGLQTMSQTRQIMDDNDKAHDVLVNYELTTNGTYIQYGKSVDAENNPVTDKVSGNWDDWAPVQVNDNCQPIINTEGSFLWDEDGVGTECTIGENGKTDPFYYHLAFGQYPTSVRDMASIYATIANDGYFHESHFVAKVYNNKGEEVPEINPLAEGQNLDAGIARDLQWVGSEIKGESKVGEDLDRDFFGKTGTWEAAGEDEDGNEYPSGYNAHAWYVGAIPQLAIASWVGNLTSESDPIAAPDGSFTGVSGGNTAYPVWLAAMERILDAKDGDDYWDKAKWEEHTEIGSETHWDIEKAGYNPGGKYCQANPEDTGCGTPEEPEETPEEGETCEDNGNGNGNGQECDTGETPGGDEPALPSDGASADCPIFGCPEENTTPSEEASPTAEDTGGDNGGGND